MKREYYSDTISAFLDSAPEAIVGALATNHEFAVETAQKEAWLGEIAVLQLVLDPYRGRGKVYFEYSIPRLGRRIDVVAIVDHVLFILEFKVGERDFTPNAVDQVWDYALDLRNFHETSHELMDPIHWFLDGKDDVRSSYYLEDVATEFHVQGLELDWACVTWDADFRYSRSGWDHWSFRGDRWNRIRKRERQSYQKNAYRVLLTRARQGMVIAVPQGDPSDPTRDEGYYSPTFDYLKHIGFEVI